MKESQELHLSDEALLRFEMNEATAEDRAHLENCPRCRSEVNQLAGAVQSFGLAARQYAAEKAATAGSWHSAKASVAHGWRDLAAGLAMAVTVLALLLGVGLPRWQAHQAALATRAAEQRQQQLAADNALLEEVDQDVSEVVPQPMQPLSLSSSNSSSGVSSLRTNSRSSSQTQ